MVAAFSAHDCFNVNGAESAFMLVKFVENSHAYLRQLKFIVRIQFLNHLTGLYW